MLALLVLSGCGGFRIFRGLNEERSDSVKYRLCLYLHINPRIEVFLHTDLVGNHPFTERGLLGWAQSTGRGNVGIARLQLW